MVLRLTQTHSGNWKNSRPHPCHIRPPLQTNLTDKLTLIILQKIGCQIFELSRSNILTSHLENSSAWLGKTISRLYSTTRSGKSQDKKASLKLLHQKKNKYLTTNLLLLDCMSLALLLFVIVRKRGCRTLNKVTNNVFCPTSNRNSRYVNGGTACSNHQ